MVENTAVAPVVALKSRRTPRKSPAERAAEKAVEREAEAAALIADLGRPPTTSERILIECACDLLVTIRSRRRASRLAADQTRLLTRIMRQLGLTADKRPQQRSALGRLHDAAGRR